MSRHCVKLICLCVLLHKMMKCCREREGKWDQKWCSCKYHRKIPHLQHRLGFLVSTTPTTPRGWTFPYYVAMLRPAVPAAMQQQLLQQVMSMGFPEPLARQVSEPWKELKETTVTLHETNSELTPENRPFGPQKDRFPTIPFFRGKLAVSFREAMFFPCLFLEDCDRMW